MSQAIICLCIKKCGILIVKEKQFRNSTEFSRLKLSMNQDITKENNDPNAG